MSPLRATVRLQFHRGFSLDDALPLVDYFAELGISHIYASPLLRARSGSLHGYDMVDPTTINPELGGEAALRRLVAALRKRGMGLILDIVSNHMAVGGSANPWWLDVLEWGRRSPHAQFFDIEWNSPDPLLEGQLLVPFLRSDYGEVLQAGELPLHFAAEKGSFYVSHYDHHFPISPPSYGELLRAADHPELEELAGRFDQLKSRADAYLQAREAKAELARLAERADIRQALQRTLEHYDAQQPGGLQRLHALLEIQHYRLASWRTAADDINWRRFFDINELGGLRVERPVVFEETHAKLFELIGEGLIDGLRIDHIDGLADPRGYCRRLRRRIDRLLAGRHGAAALRHFPIYLEKILAHGETLPDHWGVDGSTGYEFMNQVSLLQHDPAGKTALCSLWSSLSGRTADFLEEVRQARQLVLTGPLAGDFETVAQALLQVARADLMTRDITLGAIRRALLELIVHFPVYRTYISAAGRAAQDEPFFQRALAAARETIGDAERPLLDHLQRWLGGEPLRQLPAAQRKVRRYACVRFQQLTSPVAAKSMEDTACYRSAVLLSRNDVGFDTEHFSAPPEDFHEACRERAASFPHNLLCTATHDHKRGEDCRARLAVLSERADWFSERVLRWMKLAEPLRQRLGDTVAPAAGEELMLYQTLLASWPPDLQLTDSDGLRDYAERLAQWQEKALREAKLHSSWQAPNQPYENACRTFIEGLLLGDRAATLRGEIAAAAAEIGPAGALNGLVQCLLRMTTPGVPDLYQGCEFWDQSLVDPDNRRPVDFARRRRGLQMSARPAELLADWRDGRIKQWLIARTLNLRARLPALFAEGVYLPLEVRGEHAERVLAFARLHDEQLALVVVPRLGNPLLGDAEQPLIPAQAWGDTRVKLPPQTLDMPLRGLFSGTAVTNQREEMPLAEALAAFSLEVWYGESPHVMERDSDERR